LTVISSYGSPLETGHEAKGRYNLSKLFDGFELENQFAYYLDKRKKKKFNPPFTPMPGGLHPTTTSDQQLSSPHGRKNKARAPIPAHHAPQATPTAGVTGPAGAGTVAASLPGGTRLPAPPPPRGPRPAARGSSRLGGGGGTGQASQRGGGGGSARGRRARAYFAVVRYGGGARSQAGGRGCLLRRAVCCALAGVGVAIAASAARNLSHYLFFLALRPPRSCGPALQHRRNCASQLD
jgi:hypothetical protein